MTNGRGLRMPTPPAEFENPTGLAVYGPPWTLRGRIANRLRRLFGRPEREELYAYMEGALDDREEIVILEWLDDAIIEADGTIRLADR